MGLECGLDFRDFYLYTAEGDCLVSVDLVLIVEMVGRLSLGFTVLKCN